MNSSQSKLCKNYRQYMVGIDDKLYDLAKYETELRLTTLIHAIYDVMYIDVHILF